MHGEAGESNAGGGGDAFEAAAHHMEGVLRCVEQDGAWIGYGEAAEAGFTGCDGDGHVERWPTEPRGRYQVLAHGDLSIWVGDVAVKASAAGRDCSLSALEKRLGEFAPPDRAQDLRPRAPEPLVADARGWKGYVAERESHFAKRKEERANVNAHQRDEWARLADRQRGERISESVRTTSDLVFPSEAGSFRSASVLDKPFREVARAIQLGRHVTPRAMRRTRRRNAGSRHPRHPGTRDRTASSESPPNWPMLLSFFCGRCRD